MTYEKKVETLKKLSNVLQDSIFPVHVDVTNLKDHVIYKGLTKREYFAAMAMQALLSDPNITTTYSHYAENAVQAANALIAELNK
jgi:hypothetical protein